MGKNQASEDKPKDKPSRKSSRLEEARQIIEVRSRAARGHQKPPQAAELGRPASSADSPMRCRRRSQKVRRPARNALCRRGPGSNWILQIP
jgi:hypothetical protein